MALALAWPVTGAAQGREREDTRRERPAAESRPDPAAPDAAPDSAPDSESAPES
ncbi:MAG TPA: YihY/virulence factor BrkB family protein, partial [Myxococcales bacterium]|nr:YihY/virulence factor BrkB family protein [Myxococcales bacterium]